MTDAKRYPVEVFFSEEDEGYIAVARDLPGCSAFGETPSKALEEIIPAIEAWQQAARQAGNPIPEPSRHVTDPLPSGRLLLRIPRSLHAWLIESSKKEGVSLNQYLVSLLSACVAAPPLMKSAVMPQPSLSDVEPISERAARLAHESLRSARVAFTAKVAEGTKITELVRWALRRRHLTSAPYEDDLDLTAFIHNDPPVNSLLVGTFDPAFRRVSVEASEPKTTAKTDAPLDVRTLPAGIPVVVQGKR